MRFVDLFAGLGGFHQALAQLGHRCVFACEIDSDLADLYEKNFGFRPYSDIRESYRKVSHDILCAGFPCQPFSKAGDQRGFNCPQWGDLFEYVIRYPWHSHKPRFLLIENVPNLFGTTTDRTWQQDQGSICRDSGYAIQFEPSLASPVRRAANLRRAFIVGRPKRAQPLRGGLSRRAAGRLTIREVRSTEVRPTPARSRSASSSTSTPGSRLLDKLPRGATTLIPHLGDGVWRNLSVQGRALLSVAALTARVEYRGSFGKRLSGSSRREITSCAAPICPIKEKRFPGVEDRVHP